MTKLDELIEKFPECEFLIADGFDDAIIGIEWSSERVVYCVSKCLDILIERDGMTYSEAIEYFEKELIFMIVFIYFKVEGQTK